MGWNIINKPKKNTDPKKGDSNHGWTQKHGELQGKFQ